METPTYSPVLLHVDGTWRTARSGRSLPVVNPATDEVIGTVAHAGIADLDEAIAASVGGFEVWRDTGAFERSRIMQRAASLLRERVDHIATVMTLEQGKPLEQARTEVLLGADTIDWFADEGRRTYGWIIPPRVPGVRQLALKEPVGPVAAFTPWNFPINQVVRKLSAALAAGCS